MPRYRCQDMPGQQQIALPPPAAWSARPTPAHVTPATPPRCGCRSAPRPLKVSVMVLGHQ